jgi:hypothetical protein
VKPNEDTRKKADKSPLRKITPLAFLSDSVESADCPASKYYLYEAQSSLVVTGPNGSIWTALSLVDNHFHGDQEDDENEDLLLYYEKESDEASDDEQQYHDELPNWDAPTMGQFDADATIWCPKEYFLAVLKTRVGHIHEEWQYVQYRLNNVRNFICYRARA